MDKLIELLKMTEVQMSRKITGLSPKIHRGDGDCVTGNCDGGWGACDCNCDCTED